MIVDSIEGLIGNTPLVNLKKIDKNIYAKAEFLNLTGSVKDRAALYMIKDALKSKKITKKSHIIEPTSGNTGVSLAAICASLGIKLTLVMPESMSKERRILMSIFGANVVLTKASLGMKGSIQKAKELEKKDKYGIILDQFSNPSNPKAHSKTTAKEIIKDLKDIDIFVTSVGTGGTLSGVAKILKKYNPKIKIVAVEPKNSAVLSGGEANPHKIQGIGAGFIPKNLDTSLYDDIIKVKDQDALKMMKKLSKKEALLVGISSGANVWAAKKLAKKYKNKKIVTILCDTAQRYLSDL